MLSNLTVSTNMKMAAKSTLPTKPLPAFAEILFAQRLLVFFEMNAVIKLIK